jgi:hypothetical protein
MFFDSTGLGCRKGGGQESQTGEDNQKNCILKSISLSKDSQISENHYSTSIADYHGDLYQSKV